MPSTLLPPHLPAQWPLPTAQVHLLGSLGWLAYVRFGVWMVLGLALYALYGVHGAEQREREHARCGGARLAPAGAVLSKWCCMPLN